VTEEKLRVNTAKEGDLPSHIKNALYMYIAVLPTLHYIILLFYITVYLCR